MKHLSQDFFFFFSFFITAWREPASIFQWRCLPTVCQCGCFLQRFLMATSVDKLPQSEGRGTEQEQRLHFKIRLRTNTLKKMAFLFQGFMILVSL